MAATKDDPIDHIVIFTFRDDVTDEEVQTFVDGINSLIQCEGVLSVTVGKMITEEDWIQDRTGGASYGIRVRLANLKALKSYTTDDYHSKIKKECVAPLLAKPPIGYDWASPETTK